MTESNTRQILVRAFAALLSLFTLIGALVIIYENFADPGEDRFGLMQAVVGVFVSWVFAGEAFGFRNPPNWRRRSPPSDERRAAPLQAIAASAGKSAALACRVARTSGGS